MDKILHVGLDVGSTTVKIIVMDENQKQYIKIIKGIIQTQKTQYAMY